MMKTKVKELQTKDSKYIRNISIIAHVDHGKTSLTESLTHVQMDKGLEVERGITIKSAAVSLQLSRYEQSDEQKDCTLREQSYLINLIDSPGHVDFNSEVSSALRITDGSICVIDCIEGVCVQTETVLRQSILERVKPVLFLNKIDRIWLEQDLSLTDTYKVFKNTIESTNAIVSTYKDTQLGSLELDPVIGNIGFGSGYFNYGFTLDDMAALYCSKFSMKKEKLMSKLWGNNYWNPMTNKWQTDKKDLSKNALNGFCQFVLSPLQILHRSIVENKSEIYLPIISALGLNIKQTAIDECVVKASTGKFKPLLKLVMSAWLPARNCVLNLCADHLPSPLVAQQYRISSLYTGPLDTKEAQGMRNCDPNGVLSMYISKMIPTKDDGRFIAFGRVFSGTVKRGQELMILAPNAGDNEEKSSDDNKTKLIKKKVQGIVFMMGSKPESVSSVPAGNICGLMGIDQHLTRSGTITDSAQIYPFKSMKFSVSAVVKVAVDVCHAKDLKKLVTGLKKLALYDGLIKITQNRQGQKIIAGAGELHLETCLNQLQETYMKNAPLSISNPIVTFCESVSNKSGTTQTFPTNVKSGWQYPSTMVVKSVNKLNRLYLDVEPISTKLCSAIENGELKLKSDMKSFSNKFVEMFNDWDKSDAAKIWTFGCPPEGQCNVIVDKTRGVQGLEKIRDSIVGGFMQCTHGGVLCDEPLRGCRYNVLDAKIHSDPSHFGAGQIMPMAKRAFMAGQLASTPVLLEPMYLVEIDVPVDSTDGVYNTLGKVRGVPDKFENKSSMGLSMCKMTAFVPIIETFKNKEQNKPGFMQLLRENTKGKAFAMMKFSHWERVTGDPLKDGSFANQYIMNIRKRKGMKLEMPLFSEYYDRL